ncbi:nitric oxide dioxygenase [Fusarium albosuccineum]|uniref:Nitric oxide dioxygenase n=1 Tax=Fusarium albosuccineum TaxID=1237068 RepID=A0A8H4PBX3_9HYPO|nr:nitric oxide dioxygenase [Fusarium albosuccineum]
MEAVAVSHALPVDHDVYGLKIKTSIIHTPSEYIELDENGVVDNATAAHDGPVYICLAENYDYWCTELGVDRSSWDWCHWGENITFRCTDKTLTEFDFHLGDIWRVGSTVRLQVCGSRIPCMKLSWRCGQKDSWLKTLSDTGKVGLYLRILTGGRIYPGDHAIQEYASGDKMDVATITQLAFNADMKTRDTLDLLTNHTVLLRLNRFFLGRKLTNMDDKNNIGKNAWKGWRDFKPFRIVDEGNGIKSFYLRSTDHNALAWYQPGQFLTIRLPNGQVRNWSISDWQGRKDPEYYRLSIKKASNASVWMCNECTADTVLSVRSPAGCFILDWTPPAPPRQVYISAGIGITPILAMMKAQTTHPNMSGTPGVWIHVARDGDNLQFQKEFLQIENNPIKRYVFLTSPRDGDVIGRDYDFAGRPDLEILTKLVGSEYRMNPLGAAEMTLPPMYSAIYICGPSEFEKDMRGHLQSFGIPPPFIHSENFSASGRVLGELKKATVRFTKSKRDAKWTKEQPMSLLELAESVGLTPDYGCRVGACGSCAAKLKCGSVSGGVQMDGTILTCSATPASEGIEIEL